VREYQWIGVLAHPRIGSERNSKRLLLILFHGTEFQAIFSSAEQFGTELRELSVLRNSRKSAGTNQLFRLFRLPRNNFLSEIANPTSVFIPIPIQWNLKGVPAAVEALLKWLNYVLFIFKKTRQIGKEGWWLISGSRVQRWSCSSHSTAPHTTGQLM
jgi:hypothetical protein